MKYRIPPSDHLTERGIVLAVLILRLLKIVRPPIVVIPRLDRGIQKPWMPGCRYYGTTSI
ncbi:MAG: hypothetical protein AB1442_17840 [Nitrospirota bacterium]